MNDDEDQKGYTWEAGYAEGLNIRDVLEEDEGGSIERSIARLVAETRRRQRAQDRPSRVRLGIMRYVYVVLDCSRFMTAKTLHPSRINVSLKAINVFLDKFFEQNPIAQLGVIVVKDKKAERFISLTGNLRHIKEQLSSINEIMCSGEFSLQNALQLALANLKDLPGHVSREVIVIMSSLSTVDPGNIFATMELLKQQHIRCSVVGLAAEIFVCKQLAKLTNGRHDVVLDAPHLDIILSAHTVPPPTEKAQECQAVRVGFPPHQHVQELSFCLCHPDTGPVSGRGFLCQQCGGRQCSLPAECRVCRLTLVAAPQLARAFRHLLPLPAFHNIDSPPNGACYSCESRLEERCLSCKSCSHVFCLDCDQLLHESLHVCPGCE